MKKWILGIALFLVPVAAQSATPCENAYQKVNRTLLSAVAMNAAAALRTFTLTEQEVSAFGTVAVYIKFTWNAATAISMACTASPDAGTTAYTLQSCSTVAGVCTSSNASWTKAVTASANWVWRIDTLALSAGARISCVISSTGGGANDTVSAYAMAQAQ